MVCFACLPQWQAGGMGLPQQGLQRAERLTGVWGNCPMFFFFFAAAGGTEEKNRMTGTPPKNLPLKGDGDGNASPPAPPLKKPNLPLQRRDLSCSLSHTTRTAEQERLFGSVKSLAF